MPPLGSAGKNFTNRQPSSIAASRSDGVQMPGAKGIPASAAAWIGKTRWTKTENRGHIRNVVFRDITATSAPIDPTLTGFQDGVDWKPYIIKDHASMELIGYDAGHIVDGVLFDNVVIDGKPIGPANLMTNEFVRDVRFK